MPKRFALLVGVDLYIKDGSRQLPNGKIVALKNLQGAVNDVTNIALLLDQFHFNEVARLTCSPSLTDPQVPSEHEDSQPTHANIKTAFEGIQSKTCAGDFFFFHFSGHGAQLRATSNSVAQGRSIEPSLMTADYCCGEPAIRGWELNEWLWQLNEKGVRVVVLLDSCYSGGAWRIGLKNIRSPEDWTPPPNLPADETAVQGTQKKPGHRDADLDISWDINPKDFTVLAACQSNQVAAEKTEDGVVYGAFTLALSQYFQTQTNSQTSTYHTIRDHTAELIESWDLAQTPQVFGRDRLAFLEDYEPVSVAPIFGRIEEDAITLPVGNIHGVSLGTEFITVANHSTAKVSISAVNDLESKTKMLEGSVQDLSQPIQVVPFRWCSGKTLTIAIDPNLGHSFRERLATYLGDKIASSIRYTETTPSNNSADPELTWFWFGLSFFKRIINYFGSWATGDMRYVQGANSPSNDNSEASWFQVGPRENGGIKITGPSWLLGAQGSVLGWNVKGKTEDERARESAVALAHLFRFEQIFNLQTECEMEAPFEVKIKPVDGSARQFQFNFANLQAEELFFAVIVLSAGFHVKQMFPATDNLQAVLPNGRKSFGFSLKVPDELRSDEENDDKHGYRDIIRTVVASGRNLSLKSMELPDIWRADQLDKQRSIDSGRDGTLGNHFHWWVQNEEVMMS